MAGLAPQSNLAPGTSSDTCRGLIRAATGALAAALIVQPATAQERLLTLQAGATLASDSNVLRRPAGAPDPQSAQGVSGTSDRIKTTFVGLRLDKAYARQRFEIDATVTATRYDKFTSRNLDAANYHAVWNGGIGRRVIGSLSADHSESAIDAADVTSTQHIVRTNDNRRFNLDVWLFGGWNLLGGVFDTRSRTSEVFLASPAFDSNGNDIGLRYAAQSGSTVSLTQRSARGTNIAGGGVNLVNFIGSGFRVRETELRSTWMASGKSTLIGRLTRLERRDDQFPQRDFSGTTGELTYAWAVHAKWQLNLAASRNIAPWTTDVFASYRVDDTVSVAPSWRISERITARARGYRQVSEFRGALVPLTGPARRDVVYSVQLGMDWTPLRNASFAASLQRDRRSSTDPIIGYEASIASVTATFTF